MKPLNFQILRLAVPAIVSNITVPLLGLCDTTICGHLEASSYLGAIAVGTMAINAVFWCLGFLRMGTSGLTAQAFGADDRELQKLIFTRAVTLALLAGTVAIIIQGPLMDLIFSIIGAEGRVDDLARYYFRAVIMSAPAMLGTMAISGWFIGMQTSFQPMLIAILTNVCNIAMSISAVYYFQWGFEGIALGTWTANWVGFILALLLVRRFSGGKLPLCSIAALLHHPGWGRFFNVNIFIFLRSFCIMAVTMGVTSYGAQLGTDMLSANAVIMQFFTIFSHFIDGFAFAGEALTGREAGRRSSAGLKRVVARLLLWGGGVVTAFILIYMLAGMRLAHLITNLPPTLALIHEFRWWIYLFPLAGGAAFIFDGIYIGLTATRHMLYSTLLGLLSFYTIALLAKPCDNNALWLAFCTYLAARGVYLALCCPSQMRKAGNGRGC